LIGAAALVALGTGGVFYLQARADLQKAVDANCNQVSCTGPGLQHWHDAQDGVRNARIAAGAGAALVLGAAVLIVAAPSASGAAVSLAGRW
jgi:hypothetical protein